ncbi:MULTISPECIES: hypothetical protein [Chromohalobacter]|uniref:hypothetical protein n=1 Tax=Chromohalobacter TaxID=42054 RepID=UPI0005573E11|nr:MULTISPECIES: hypothetical protein [Chromohalobacter]MBZ5876687.1 hypothetical protein [Chromohalobacter salexigens]MDF9436131.1 hypothetical protein [Chromohalobacter israelensis]NQY44395.1 hypothetical protein [Chromohalobacter sp.]PWW38223.1 hypothetical protein DFO74_10950 [Chromohalobacter salexigens]
MTDRLLGVLTGDVVGSRRITDRQRLDEALDTTLALLERQFGAHVDRYRGDGFQVALRAPGEAMTAAVLARAALLRYSPSRRDVWDARIAVGIGYGHLPEAPHIASADGDAFVRSGQALDRLSESDERLALVLPQPDDDLALLTRFADVILQGWTHNAAEVVYWQLRHPETQQALATRLGRAQSTIHQRLSAARWPLIQDYLAHVGERLNALMETMR